MLKIAVCVKAVPDASLKRIDPSTMRLDRSGELVLNTPDRHAVEAALRLQEDHGGAEVVAVSLGPPEALAALRFALAMGADRAVLVSDEAAVGSDLLGTARALAAALERETPDLVLFGQQALDSNGAVLWGAVADRLRLPLVSRAVDVSLDAGRVVAFRRGDVGRDTIEAPLPCAVAVSTASNEPRTPTFRQPKRAFDRPHEVLSLAELGGTADEVGEAGRRTEVIALAVPTSGRDARRIVDAGEAADELLEFLIARKLVL